MQVVVHLLHFLILPSFSHLCLRLDLSSAQQQLPQEYGVFQWKFQWKDLLASFPV